MRRNLPVSAWDDVPDPRDPRGVRYRLQGLLQGLLLGMLTGALTLRDVEALMEDLVVRRTLRVQGTPSDTTYDRIIRVLPVAPLVRVLQQQVLRMHRSKQLPVLDDIGISLVAVDGKAIATDREQLHPESQRQSSDDSPRYVLRVLRAVHVGSATKPILGQRVIPADAGEVDTFPLFVEQLFEAYGNTTLLECLSVDAGFTSRANLELLGNGYQVGFIAGLKGNQPKLFDAARRILGAGEAKPWGGWDKVVEEHRDGRNVTLHFARTEHPVVLEGWPCIRQVWRVRQRVERGDRVTWEDRYFVTNLPWGRLTPRRCLAAIRAHWGIENDANWTMDVIWKEDARAWVRQGLALEVLAVLRCIAFNLIRLLRHRTFRSEDNRALPYRRLLQLVRMALTTHLEPAVGFG